MAEAGRRILFVGHGAERSGPPIFLLHLQRWLHEHAPHVAFETVLARGGELEPAYRALGPVHVLEPRWTVPRVLEGGLGRLGRPRPAGALRRARHRARLRRVAPADLVYLNTASVGGIRAVAALPGQAPLLAHVHELDAALRYGLGEDERRFLFGRADRYVAASQAVADNLVDGHGVEPESVRVHHEMVDAHERPDPSRADRVRSRLDLGDGSPVVAASGMTDWRKAPDLFVRLAWEVSRRPGGDQVRFLWVGGATDGPEWWPLDHDLRRLGLADRVHFLGPSPHPLDELSLCDLFVLPSREDAFPLTCLEAGSLGVPVVCFDTGGMPELVVPTGGGAVVPYPDVGAMADAVVDLLENDRHRRAAGERLRRTVVAEHDVPVVAPRLLAEVEALW